jgi:hypothetical protein
MPARQFAGTVLARRPQRVPGLVSQQRRRNRGKHGLLADLLKKSNARSISKNVLKTFSGRTMHELEDG